MHAATAAAIADLHFELQAEHNAAAAALRVEAQRELQEHLHLQQRLHAAEAAEAMEKATLTAIAQT